MRLSGGPLATPTAPWKLPYDRPSAFPLCHCSPSLSQSHSGEDSLQLTPIPNLSSVFLLAVLVTAVSFGIWPAIYASVLSFLAYDFFFIPPIYTFTIAEPYELLALVNFLVVAVISSALAGRVREQARISAAACAQCAGCMRFTRRLSGLATLDDSCRRRRQRNPCEPGPSRRRSAGSMAMTLARRLAPGRCS